MCKGREEYLVRLGSELTTVHHPDLLQPPQCYRKGIGEGKLLAQGHRASKQQAWNLLPLHLASHLPTTALKLGQSSLA